MNSSIFGLKDIHVHIILGGNEKRERIAFHYLYQMLLHTPPTTTILPGLPFLESTKSCSQKEEEEEEKLLKVKNETEKEDKEVYADANDGDEDDNEVGFLKYRKDEFYIILSSGALGKTELRKEYRKLLFHLLSDNDNNQKVEERLRRIRYESDNRAVCTVSNFTTMIPYLFKEYGYNQISFITILENIQHVTKCFLRKISDGLLKSRRGKKNKKKEDKKNTVTDLDAYYRFRSKCYSNYRSRKTPRKLTLIGVSLDISREEVSIEIPYLKKQEKMKFKNKGFPFLQKEEEEEEEGNKKKKDAQNDDQMEGEEKEEEEETKNNKTTSGSRKKQRNFQKNEESIINHNINEQEESEDHEESLIRISRDVFRIIVWCVTGFHFSELVTFFHLNRNPTLLYHPPYFKYLHTFKSSTRSGAFPCRGKSETK